MNGIEGKRGGGMIERKGKRGWEGEREGEEERKKDREGERALEGERRKTLTANPSKCN
jgi:hypothetical protein